MFTLSVTADVERLSRGLDDWTRNRIPSITRNALNDTAPDMVEAERAKIRGVFDRPTPFVQKAVVFPRYLAAKKDDLVATIIVRDEANGTPPSKFLRAEILGGGRRKKAYELILQRAGILREDEYTTLAIGFRRNQYGNIPGPTLVAILSQLRAFAEVGNLMNETARSKQRAGSKRSKRYFVPKPGSRLRRGIYERQGKSIKAVMIFVRQPHYQKRYDFGQAAEAKAKRVFPTHWQRYFETEKAKQALGPS